MLNIRDRAAARKLLTRIYGTRNICTLPFMVILFSGTVEEGNKTTNFRLL